MKLRSIDRNTLSFVFANFGYLLFHLGNVIRRFPKNRIKFGEHVVNINMKHDGKSRTELDDKNDMKRYLEITPIFEVLELNQASIKTN